MTDVYNNGAFCFAPWVHMHVTPDTQIHPCCVADGNFKGDASTTNKSNIEIMNIEGLKTIRKQMLNGEKPLICRRCFEHEDQSRSYNSMRRYFNDNYNNKKSRDLVENKTHKDGYLEEVDIQYFDIRFGNICNFKCRMCGHALSSTWYDEHIEMVPDYNKPKFIHVDMYEQVEEFFDSVVEIYFAGGEPLLYPEHYKILKRLIELGRTDVHLKYNSNLSTIHYKKEPILDLWKQFKQVSIGASIDGSGSVIEYIRTGADWETIKSNFRQILDSGNVQIYVSPTIGILNIEMLPEFHKELYDLGFIGHPMTLGHTMLTNFVDYPNYQNIKYMPKPYKEYVTDKFNKHIEWLKNNHPETLHVGTIDKWIGILDYMNLDNPNNEHEMVVLQGQLNYWDSLNKGRLNWREQLPHLVKWFD